MTLKQILILVILIFASYALFLIVFINQENREDELNRTLNQVYDSLSKSGEQRDSLFRINDSLTVHSKALFEQLELKDKQIKSIKGRYNHIPQDSLGELMNRRANGTKTDIR